jgi:rhamnulose-1-phosphate aldolase/alcohol dehydrogenase
LQVSGTIKKQEEPIGSVQKRIMQNTIAFNHVDYLWDDAKAAALTSEVDLFIYRSNILGADLRITNYAGGNTSCKTTDIDPLTNEAKEVMWVKGSGGDIGSLTKKGCAVLYTEKLHQLKQRYRGLAFEDEMVALFNYCLHDMQSAAPSIDTPLHGLLPYKHIDHLHPDAIIAIAASKDGQQITEQLFGGRIAWIPWQRPGFDLGLQLEKCVTDNPHLKGIILGGHGLFTWGNTSFDCYINTLETIEKAAAYLETQYGLQKPVFGGQRIQSLAKEASLQQAAAIAPILRGLVSSAISMVGHFTDDARVLEFINSEDLAVLGPKGTSCPDHFLRTKIRPMILAIEPTADIKHDAVIQTIQQQVEDYRKAYAAYYDRCKHANSPAIRDSNPVVILYPGVGMFTFAKDKFTARVAAEFYINAINVMKGAEAMSAYVGLSEQEAFDIEYWLLEEAKLQRLPKPKSLAGKIAYVTGAAGGIGNAICELFLQNGACVALSDKHNAAVAADELKKKYGKDFVIGVDADVTNAQQLQQSLHQTILGFGGVDILVNCAGLSISKPIESTTVADWDLLDDVLVKAQFILSQQCVEIIRKQASGGDIVNIASKNGLYAGPNNVAYGTAKGAQIHMSRLLAAELGKDKIRVNVVNPDAVVRGSKIWENGWAEGRAKAYGVTVEELPAYYAKRTLLNEEILPEDIAKAVLVLVDGSLKKSTGNIINVDGGFAGSFLR